MKLWVDDERPAPKGWTGVTTAEAAITVLAAFAQEVSEVSLDHDLGGDSTSREVVLWMCEADFWPWKVYVHSQNPVGREWLEGMINRYGPGVSR